MNYLFLNTRQQLNKIDFSDQFCEQRSWTDQLCLEVKIVNYLQIFVFNAFGCLKIIVCQISFLFGLSQEHILDLMKNYQLISKWGFIFWFFLKVYIFKCAYLFIVLWFLGGWLPSIVFLQKRLTENYSKTSWAQDMHAVCTDWILYSETTISH